MGVQNIECIKIKLSNIVISFTKDDVVMGTLTVRENFMFSANLRLPKTVTLEEKRRRVDDTIAELGLIHCADSKVWLFFI